MQPSARATTQAQKKYTAHNTEDQLGTHQTAAAQLHVPHQLPPPRQLPRSLTGPIPVQGPKGMGHIAPAGEVEVSHRPH